MRATWPVMLLTFKLHALVIWQLPWRPLGETVTWILVVRQHTMSHMIWHYVGDGKGAAGVAVMHALHQEERAGFSGTDARGFRIQST